MYSDALFATTVSRRGNRCVEIHATNFGWSCSFPMKLKSEAHKVLSLLFQQYGVPPAVICDNAKKIVLDEVNRKLNEASCQVKCSQKNKKLKKGFSRKLIKSGTPKRIWDDCLNLSPVLGPILQMASTNLMGKSLKS